MKGTVHKTRRSSDHPYVYIRRMYTVAAIQLLRSTAWSILAYWLQLYLSTAGPVAVGCSTLLHVLHRPLLLYPMSPEVCSIWVWQMQPHLSVDSSLVALGRTAGRGTVSSWLSQAERKSPCIHQLSSTWCWCLAVGGYTKALGN